MCHFPIFLCFPECAFSQPSFPNVVDSSLLFPSRSVVADKLFISTHINKKGTFCGWLSTFVTLLYRNVCKNNSVNVKTNTVQLIWWVPAFIYAGHYTWTLHVSRCVRKQATAQTWWEKVEGLGTVLDGTSPWALRACDWDWEPLYCLCFHCMVLSVGYLKHFRNLTRSCMEETSVKDECGGCWNIYSIIFWIL